MTSLGLSAALVATILLLASATRSSAAPRSLAPGSIQYTGKGIQFGVDVTWPKVLPNNWIIGQVGGLSVDKADNIWVYQRPGSDTADEVGAAQSPPSEGCCFPAPPVLEYSSTGVLINAWGPIEGTVAACKNALVLSGGGVTCNDLTKASANGNPPGGYSWFAGGGEHGINATNDGFVWVGGNGGTDSQVLKFDRFGNFKLRIGGEDVPAGTFHCPNNLATTYVCHVSQFFVDTPNQEVYMSDGYSNNRVSVWDANSGAFKRAWGAFGVTAMGVGCSTPGCGTVLTSGYGLQGPLQATYSNPAYCGGSSDSTCPGNPNPSANFRNPVHCVNRDPNTGYIWACDRSNNRIQVFTSGKGTVGTAGYVQSKYVGQCYFAQATLGNTGSLWDIKFWPKTGGKDEVAFSIDGSNEYVREYLPQPDPSSGSPQSGGGPASGPGSKYCPLVGQFGHAGRNAGFFHWGHVGDFDSHGNYYSGEVDTGKRVQKFLAIGGNSGDNDHNDHR